MTDENARKAVRSFEDLEVFQRAYRLALDVHEASLRFPKHEQSELARQLRKASKSVCANIAEGRQAADLVGGVWPLPVDRDWIGGRDAGVDPLRVRSWLCRRRRVAALAGRLRGGGAHASGLAPRLGRTIAVILNFWLLAF